ncbi:SCP2 domain-containing protein [Halothiobacillus sp. DCM-1]|uniref:ubiquinone biosynthesis accessory factor UbiJ n=1 Tax=Halothiobacillus sp. DCM-1 TaxID=3112558 RepID=UPI0032484752
MSLLKLPTPVLLWLEGSLNRLIRRDPVQWPRWQRQADQRFRLELRDPSLSFVLCVTETGILLLRDIEGMPTATIRASTFGLIRAQQSAAPMDALFAGDVQIEGDQAAAESVLRLLLAMDGDFFALLAEKIGVAPAGWLDRQWQARRAERAIWRQTRRMELKDFLVFERDMLPTASSVQNWVDGVDAVRDHTDQLIARITRLEHLGAE